MPEKYIAFDVETPNSANHRMSAIGLAVIEGNHIVEEFATLINPEVYFSRFNIQLTGLHRRQWPTRRRFQMCGQSSGAFLKVGCSLHITRPLI